MEKFTLAELKEKRKDIADGIGNPAVPENFKPSMKEKLVLIDARIAELEGVQKTKIVKPKAKPKKVVTPKAEKKPTVKVVKQKKEGEEKPVKKGKQKVVKQKDKELKEKSMEKQKEMKNIKKIDVFLPEKKIEIWNEDFNRWEKSSFQEAGINYEEEYEIEEYLRDEFQERGYDDIEIDFVKDKETTKKQKEVGKKDDVAECKKILEAANYDVKSKVTKGKDGKKRKITAREPRQDRTIIKDRTESVFVTMTKAYNSDQEKEDNKELLSLVESVKEMFIKIMTSLDKLVANKSVDEIKKIKELLKKLVN